MPPGRSIVIRDWGSEGGGVDAVDTVDVAAKEMGRNRGMGGAWFRWEAAGCPRSFRRQL